MSVWIVFEYDDNGNKVVGVYRERENALEEHKKFPAWRFIEEYEVE